MPCKGKDVVPARAQGWHLHGDDVQSIVEILAKISLLDLLLQIPVGGCHHADIDLDGLASPDSLHFPFLQGAQKLHLQLRRHFAYFVQKEGTLVGELEAPLTRTVGPRVGPLFRAKELRFDEVLGHGTAVDRHKRALAAAHVVQCLDHKFLACAAFTGHKHGTVRPGHPAHHIKDSL